MGLVFTTTRSIIFSKAVILKVDALRSLKQTLRGNKRVLSSIQSNMRVRKVSVWV